MSTEPEPGQYPVRAPLDYLPPAPDQVPSTADWPYSGQPSPDSAHSDGTPPHGSSSGGNWNRWVISVCVSLLAAMIGIIVHNVNSLESRTPAATTPATTPAVAPPTPRTPGQTPTIVSPPASTAYVPAPVLPKVLDDFPVVEAIDIPIQPTLGPSWDVTDGDPSMENLRTDFLVTPCGVLVTMLTSEGYAPYGMPQAAQGLASRIMGYDIASGDQLWSTNLRQLTGQTDPVLDADPTYTPDCRMVVATFDTQFQSSSGPGMATSVIDLATGDGRAIDTGVSGGCAAAGEGWVGCWSGSEEPEVRALSVDDVAHPSWRESADANIYSIYGDIVVTGMIWTPEGYRDPATGIVGFGTDAKQGSRPWEQSTDDWVVYVDPYRPGGYRSDVAVRVEGPMGSTGGDCQITVWDPVGDSPAWPAYGMVPCGSDYRHSWVVSGQALIVAFEDETADIPQIRAFGLADGNLLWERQGLLSDSGWDSLYSSSDKPRGISQDYVRIITGSGNDDVEEHIVRISDGVDVTSPYFGVSALSETMGYEASLWIQGDPYILIGYTFDPAHPGAEPVETWRIPISADPQRVCTFATNGTMYLIRGQWHGQMWLTALLP